MIEVKIPQEIGDYDAKLIGPFTMRQALCGAIAALLAYLLYNNLSGIIAQDRIIGLILLIDAPLGLIGWIKPYNMRFEKFFIAVLFNTLISSSKRFFKSNSIIDKIESKLTTQPVKELNTRKEKDKKTKQAKRNKPVDYKKAQKRYRKYTFT